MAKREHQAGTKKDYISGVYRSGIFNAYGLHGDYHVKKFEAGSNEEARALANSQKEVHGTYKDGVFRPAELSGRKGHANTATFAPGENFGVNYTGELYDSQGIAIGRLDEDGKPQFYRLTPKGSYKSEHFGRDIESDEHGRSRDFNLADGQHIRGYVNENLTDLANYISRSNKVLGKFRKDKKSHDPKTGVKIQVYEANIPQFQEDTRMMAGTNAETVDEKEHIIIIDKRLKPYEKIATVAHEMSHVYGGKQIMSRQDLQEEEHEAHLAAINQLSTLYKDYDALKKATAGSEHPFFDVTKQSKGDLGQAVAHLVGTRAYFGIRNEEIQENVPTFRKIKKDLEGKVEAMIAIPAIALSLFFLSFNITGNAIANISQSSTNIFGAGLFLISLVMGFFWLKAKKAVSLFKLQL